MCSPLVSRKPRSTHTDVSYMLAFVRQFINVGFGRNLQRSRRLYVLRFGREQAGQPGHIRKHLTQLTQLQAAEFHIHIL